MTQTILSIPFSDTPLPQLIDRVLGGGLVVVPSGPGLAVDLRRSAEYRKAVTEADVALADSGAMVLFWHLFRGRRQRRISGLRFLEALLEREVLKVPGQTYWVHPTASQQQVNETWLRAQGFAIGSDDSHIAPMYPASGICDEALMEKLMKQRPKVIILCIGGGVQERLGWWLREQYRTADLPCPAIICTGAAIGFLTGNQVRIPTWADRCYLGWLFRCISQPKTFIPRYWSAVPLAWLILRYGGSLPPLSRKFRELT